MDHSHHLAPVAYTSRLQASGMTHPVGAAGGLRTMFQITIPLNDIPPLFKDAEVNKSFNLLQSTAVCRDGGRVPTPERMQVLEMAAGLGKHRLRRQQQLLLDIAQRCKEQNITSLSTGLSRKCPLSSFGDKYQRDIREYSTNTILFKTWGNAFDAPLEIEPRRVELPTPKISFERGNTYFPVRRIKKLPPKELYMTTLTPKLQVGYSNGLLIKEPFDLDKKKALINDRKINGPIQLGLYNTPKNDLLQPLILPSIKYVGVDLDKIDTYVKSKKMKISATSGDKDGMPNKGITDGFDLQRPGPSRIIIHSRHPEHEITLVQVPKSDSTPGRDPRPPPPTERSKGREHVTAVAMLPNHKPNETDPQPPSETFPGN